MAKSTERHSGLRGEPVRRLGALLALLILIWPAIAYSKTGPVAPCGSDRPRPYPAFADSPNARNWRAGDIATDWAPAACIGWASQRFTVLTALAGHFRFDGSVDDLLARFGAQSAWDGIMYWSATDGRWETLITDAAALDSSNPQQRRTDFTLPELKSGADLYFLQKDNRSSDAVTYRMRVTAVEPNRLVVTIENVSAVSLFIFTLFDPGDLESTYIFERLAPTDWGYYSLSGAREGAAVIGNHDASYVNRAAAIYRHLIGIPGDQEPPLAR
ncbi:MAG: hypothetical protein QOK29_2691 [Rhodospirillaceae bacterium]|nr:hypothetical protein [Rhodospirillaceae bacterium]